MENEEGDAGDPVTADTFDADGDDLSYTITGGADMDAFGMTLGTGQITVNAGTKLNFEGDQTSYELEASPRWISFGGPIRLDHGDAHGHGSERSATSWQWSKSTLRTWTDIPRTTGERHVTSRCSRATSDPEGARRHHLVRR